MKVLLTGSSGQLGKAIIDLKPKGVDLIITRRDNLDLSDQNECIKKIKLYKPDWIINSGAYTNVDFAENNSEEVFKVNSLAPKTFSESILCNKGKLLQISTDYVFDGKKNVAYGPYEKRCPINVYGSTKTLGESYIEKILGGKNKGIILRSSWVMGPEKNNFLSKILDLLSEKSEISVVSDQVSCPTSTFTLAKMCWCVIKKEKKIFDSIDKKVPILHCCDGGRASWYDVAEKISEFGLDLGLIKNKSFIKPVNSIEYKTSAIRPSFSLLNCESSFEILNFKVNHWKDEVYKNMTKILHNNYLDYYNDSIGNAK